MKPNEKKRIRIKFMGRMNHGKYSSLLYDRTFSRRELRKGINTKKKKSESWEK